MKIVLTGSSSGIGRNLTSSLLVQGHEVWGLARSDQSDFATLHPASFRASRIDVTAWDQWSDLAETIAATWGHVDALVLCAGVQGEIGPAVTVDPVRWSETVRQNIDGTFFPIRALYRLLPHTSERRAKIICFSGGGATKARANFSAYGAAKTAIVRLVENLADEWGTASVDINAVAPGAINTRLTAEVLALGPTVVGPAEYAAAQKQQTQGGAGMGPVTRIVDWLLSPASDRLSGRLLAAVWDPWADLGPGGHDLADTDIYTLRRILPKERGQAWGD